MVEHIAAHVLLHSNAHHVTVELHKVVEQHAYDIKREQENTRGDYGAVQPIRDVVGQHSSSGYGIENSDE